MADRRGSGVKGAREKRREQAARAQRREAERAQRVSAMAVVANALRDQGRMKIWLASQLGITKGRLNTYFRGRVRVPEWIIAQSESVLELTPGTILGKAPRDVLIQVPTNRGKVPRRKKMEAA